MYTYYANVYNQNMRKACANAWCTNSHGCSSRPQASSSSILLKNLWSLSFGV